MEMENKFIHFFQHESFGQEEGQHYKHAQQQK